MGKFSSDRAIREYCEKIWDAHPVKVELQPYQEGKAALKMESGAARARPAAAAASVESH